MKINIIALGLALAAFVPVAGQAASNCGVPQGYGTNNSHTFNRSTCGLNDNSYNIPNTAKETEEASEGKNIQPASKRASSVSVPEPSAATVSSPTSGN